MTGLCIWVVVYDEGVLLVLNLITMQKKKLKKGKKAKQIKSFYHSNQLIIVISILFVGLLLVCSLDLYKLKYSSNITFQRTELNSMKKIPQDIKKEMTKQIQQASVSATLNVPILMYHYVEYVQNKKDTERQLLNVNPNIFEQQIETLKNAGYTFITAKDLGDILEEKMQLPQKAIVITFDDGHWDLDTNVLPILKKFNVHATAYIVPGFIGTNTDSLSQTQLQDVINSGLIDVGAHTVDHMSLRGKPLAIVKYEVEQSKVMLEKQYHIHVYSFAYPYGTFDKQVLTVVKQAGFTTAASTITGNEQSLQNRYFLFRLRPGYMTGQALLNYLNIQWQSYRL